MLGILLLGAACLLFYYFLIRPLSFFKNKGIKQGSPVWVFGDFWRSVFRILAIPELIDYLYKQWPNERYFGMYQFVVPALCVRDPELIKQITVKAFDHFEDHKSLIPEDVDRLWAKNLVALKGQQWREMRAILSPSFTSSKMRAMFVLMSDCAENFADFYLQKNEDVIEVDLKDIFSRFSNDVITTTAFGIEVNSLVNPDNNFYSMGKRATNFTGFKFLGLGQRWREMRPILSPSFTSSKMRTMFVLMSDCAKNFTDFFIQKSEDVIDVDLKDIFSRFSNDVIATTAFGVEVNSLANPDNNFYAMGKRATNFTGFLQNSKFIGYFVMPKAMELLKIHLFDDDVSKFFYELVNETIRAREEKGIVRPDMIQLLLEARKGKAKPEETNHIDAGFSVVQEVHLNSHRAAHVEITNEDIASQAMIFFFGGFETVSTFTSFIGYELAIHPDIQERLRKEIFETLDECKGNLTYEALLKMRYMDMVISEGLRKWPVAVVVDRQCTKPYTIQPTQPDEKPVDIDVGEVLWLPIYALHHDPKHFPDPERFDPERFSDDNKHNINPYAYIPFGMGPRNCIASRFALLENKVVIFHILANFEIIPTKETKIPIKLAKSVFNLSSANGFPLAFKRIK